MSDAPSPSSPAPLPPADDPLRISLRTASILLLFTLAFTALMAGVYRATKPVLDATALDAKRRTIAEVLPADGYDNDLLNDAVTLPPIPALNLSEPTQLYRARQAGQPAALVLEAAALDGYAGEIRLILAVRADGRLAAVRVVRHKETPGLGDYIDARKDKRKAHPWIAQFSGRSLGDPPPEQWRVKKDGGHFDQRTGATISARAVTQAIARTLAWVDAHAAALYALPVGQTFEEKTP